MSKWCCQMNSCSELASLTGVMQAVNSLAAQSCRSSSFDAQWNISVSFRYVNLCKDTLGKQDVFITLDCNSLKYLTHE